MRRAHHHGAVLGRDLGENFTQPFFFVQIHFCCCRRVWFPFFKGYLKCSKDAICISRLGFKGRGQGWGKGGEGGQALDFFPYIFKCISTCNFCQKRIFDTIIRIFVMMYFFCEAYATVFRPDLTPQKIPGSTTHAPGAGHALLLPGKGFKRAWHHAIVSRTKSVPLLGSSLLFIARVRSKKVFSEEKIIIDGWSRCKQLP